MQDRASLASYAGSLAVTSAGALDWNLICMLGGLILGVLTFGVNWYYKYQNSKAYRAALSKGVKLNEPQN